MRLIYPVVAVAVVIILLISVPILTSSKEDFSSRNTEWNGYSQLRDLTAQQQSHFVSDISSLSAVADKNQGVLVLANPTSSVPFTQDDIARVKDFVANGGSLLLTNDFGNANALLEGLGVGHSVRFNGSLLRDSVDNWADSADPVITTFVPSGITAGINRVDFNYGTMLDVNATRDVPVTVLAWSGPVSYGDKESPNREAPPLGTNQTTGRPVLVYLSYGKGKVILFADPSVFINYMLGKDDNQRLYTNIIGNLTAGDSTAPVIFAESQRVQQPLFGLAYNEVNATDVSKYAFTIAAVVVFMLGVYVLQSLRFTARRTRQEDTPDTVTLNEEAVTDDLIARNPQWSRAQLKKLLSAMKAHARRR